MFTYWSDDEEFLASSGLVASTAKSMGKSAEPEAVSFALDMPSPIKDPTHLKDVDQPGPSGIQNRFSFRKPKKNVFILASQATASSQEDLSVDSDMDPDFRPPKTHVSDTSSDDSDEASFNPKNKKLKRIVAKSKSNKVGPADDKMRTTIKNKQKFRGKTGQLLEYGKMEYLMAYGEFQKVSRKTENKYRAIYKSFLDYVEAEEGPDVLKLMLEKLLPIDEVALLLARYLSERINTTVFKQTGVAQKLDLSTMDRYWYAICYCIKKDLGYHPGQHDEFEIARKAKNTSMRLAKQTPGLGEGAHRSESWSKAMLLYLLRSDHLNDWSGSGLLYRFYVLTILFFMPRVREEVFNLTRGSFKRIYKNDRTLHGMIYIPRGQTKCDRGDRTQQDNSGYYKRYVD